VYFTLHVQRVIYQTNKAKIVIKCVFLSPLNGIGSESRVATVQEIVREENFSRSGNYIFLSRGKLTSWRTLTTPLIWYHWRLEETFRVTCNLGRQNEKTVENWTEERMAVTGRVTRKRWPPVHGPHYGPGPRTTLRTGLRTTPTDPLYGPTQNRVKM